MSIAEPTTRKWTRDEYYQMADMGLFQDQRVELIDGEIIEMAPQKELHSVAVSLVQKALENAFGPGFWVRTQMPLFFTDSSEPEPDVAVVAGNPRDFIGTDHPRSALLVVEVSDSTLRYDRKRKANLYAAAGVQDYWIINLVDLHLEIHRQPVAEAPHPNGFRYALTTVHKTGETIAALARPDHSIDVAELLP